MAGTQRQARLQTLTHHQGRLARALERFAALDNRYFWLRLVVLALGVVGTSLASWFAPGMLWLWLALVTGGLFAGVVYRHRRLDVAVQRFELSLEMTATQIARMQLDWGALPALPEDVPPTDHPFQADLNLTGARSIHRLLDSAQSQGGSERLRSWLLATTPHPDITRARQNLLGELIPLAGFRRRLALQGALATRGAANRWDGEQLLKWLDQHAREKARTPLVLLLSGLGLVNLALLGLNFLSRAPAYWIGSTFLYLMIYTFIYQGLRDVFDQATHLVDGLRNFQAVSTCLERYPYRTESGLAGLCAPFWQGDQRPSRMLRRINWIASAASLQRNQLIWFFLNAFLPWDLFFAEQLERSKLQVRHLLPGWLDAWYELEALNSLANFGYLNPDFTFPHLMDGIASQGPVFEAIDLGHPLLPDDVRVCNEFRLDHLGEMVLVTGSNMSGKSTFLRTVGVNLCLAFAGGPVCAARMKVIPLRLFTCISVSDSLSDGISYFYAEVKRLKALLVELEREDPCPLFFLIDEIFRGTNNRERRIGSQAYVRALAGQAGVGLISTHDLELVNLAEEIPGLLNYHFREEVQGGRMVFDYQLRAGPSPTTNALKIMQSEGLPVSALDEGRPEEPRLAPT